jgi:hypothetical protein
MGHTCCLSAGAIRGELQGHIIMRIVLLVSGGTWIRSFVTTISYAVAASLKILVYFWLLMIISAISSSHLRLNRLCHQLFVGLIHRIGNILMIKSVQLVSLFWRHAGQIASIFVAEVWLLSENFRHVLVDIALRFLVGTSSNYKVIQNEYLFKRIMICKKIPLTV